jgi:hypothetical protein
MVKTAVALLRKIWREICRQIFRERGTLTLPVPAHPRGQLSGAVPGMFVSPPEPAATVTCRRAPISTTARRMGCCGTRLKSR